MAGSGSPSLQHSVGLLEGSRIGGFNAKARRRKGAPDPESGFLLCVFAPWRLCVEDSSLSVESVVPFLCLRLAALSLRFSAVRASAFPAVICGFLSKAATDQFFSISAFTQRIKAN
jgi:hypothetical protein